VVKGERTRSVLVITERALTTNHLPDEKRLMAVCKATCLHARKKAAPTGRDKWLIWVWRPPLICSNVLRVPVHLRRLSAKNILTHFRVRS